MKDVKGVTILEFLFSRINKLYLKTKKQLLILRPPVEQQHYPQMQEIHELDELWENFIEANSKDD
jgi:hypothetical protein